VWQGKTTLTERAFRTMAERKLSGASSATEGESSESGVLCSPVRQSVLAVDDEENFLTLLDWFLSQRGYDVYTAANVEQALLLAQERAFDVALLDLRVGSSNDGIFLLDELMQRLPGIKVIMMTAYPTVSAIKQAFDKGASRFLTKPVDLQELSEAIKTLL
jgi:DNA-binding NtrC family response regulator